MASSAHPAPSSLEAPLDDSPHPPPLRSLPNLDNDDEAMTDDMRVAISALGLMRQGSLEGTTPAPNPPLPPTSLPHSTSTFPTVSTAAAPPSTSSSSYYHSRATSSSHRSDPSRSTSTASIASNSEAWTIASGTSDTGFSSPVESVSVSSGGGPAWVFGYSDAEMNDMKGLGEAELDGQETLALRGENGEEQHPSQDPRFMARVSQLPYVSGGLEWYERSKASSRVVKLGADLVESSFSAVSGPITSQLGGLDDFACRQLDRISVVGSPGRKSPATQPQHLPGSSTSDDERRGRTREAVPVDLQSGGGSGGTAHGAERESSRPRDSSSGQVVAQQRSRWQTVLVEAGGLGAAVSGESLKSLRYCLQWLLYATAHLDHQIATLRDFILSLRAHNRTSTPYSASSNALVAASASAHLSQIKHDVVETIRKVVEVVSKYAGAALPEQAKRYVRQSILGLPVKWASAIENRPSGGPGPISAAAMGRRRRETSSGSSVSGAAAGYEDSEVGTPRPERMHESYYRGEGAGGQAGPSNGHGKFRERPEHDEDGGAELSPTEEAADRVLTFAVESLDMLRAVAGIFGESVEKAEAWIERLRIVGLDRQRQRQAAAAAAEANGQPYPHPPPSLSLPPSHHTSASTSPLLSSSATFDDSPSSGAGTKRRRASARSSSEIAACLPAGAAGGSNGAGGAVSSATDVGGVTDGEGEGLGRRKRGAWREGA